METEGQQALRERIRALPTGPGVYLMKDKDGRVFYIGKAKNLRERVRGYFSGADTRAFVALLDRLLVDLEVVLTDSEKEALLVENELIKSHRPRFNIKLTDDKRFLCLRLDVSQAYPRLEVVRRFKRDQARYFGPYHSASAIRETLRLVNRHFQLRTCTDQVMRNRSRPCLQYQIKRCPAPCVFDLSGGSYAANVNDVAQFLEGRSDELVASLTERMHQRAEAMAFEAAGALRDQIRAVTRSLERQAFISSDFINRDCIGLYREGPTIEIHVMRTRHGRLIEARRFSFADLEQPTSDILGDFLARYYTHEADLPDELLLPEATDWNDALTSVLSERRGAQVKVLFPKRGDKKRLIDLANRNARQAFADQARERGAAKTALERLKDALHLKALPQRLECVDISHMMGRHIVASIVAFEGGVPNKKLYRRYKVRSIQEQDDFKSMYEIMGRRARRGLEHNDLPNLFIIDGGKGQLAAARAALKDFGVDQVDLIGLAKSRLDRAEPHRPLYKTRDKTPGDEPIDAADTSAEDTLEDFAQPPMEAPLARSAERVFVEGHKTPIVLRQNSAELFLLVRARDEAHRFAITFHRQQRGKSMVRSRLDSIVGIGPKRRQALLKAFGSVGKLAVADEQAIAAIVGLSAAQAVVAALAGERRAQTKTESKDTL